MTEKVKVTQLQADAIEFLLETGQPFEQLMRHNYENNYKGEYRVLNDTEIDTKDLALALLIGYEIEPEYKAGDWVSRIDGDTFYPKGNVKVEKVSAIKRDAHPGTGVETEYACHGEGGSWGTPFSHLRHATSEEIQAEKERRKWAKIGRKVGEFKYSDIGYDWEGLLITSDDLKETYESGDLQGFYREEDFITFEGGDTND